MYNLRLLDYAASISVLNNQLLSCFSELRRLEKAKHDSHYVTLVAPTTQTTTENGESRLVLRKTVENITQGTAEVPNQNQAIPGDILKYRIYYRNTGTGSIADLKVNDNVPNYTDFVIGSESCDTTPIGLTCIAIRNQNDLRWDFTGSLSGGLEGSMSYEVSIDN